MSNDWTVGDSLREYHKVRDKGYMKQGLYRDDYGAGQVYACALGAFFRAEGQEDARARGCVTGIMPEWLVEITPGLFDAQTLEDAVAWSDRLYSRGGLVDRANRLERAVRDNVWQDAKEAMSEELSSNTCILRAAGINEKLGKAVRDNPYAWSSVFSSMGQDDVHRFAMTVLDKIEDALETRGV